MTLKVRTGYSFRQAAGKLEEVMDRLQEIGSEYAPITDRASTFGFYRWSKLAKERGLKPVFGVELGVVGSVLRRRQGCACLFGEQQPGLRVAGRYGITVVCLVERSLRVRRRR